MILDRGKWQPGMFIGDSIVDEVIGLVRTDSAPPLSFKARELVEIADMAIMKALAQSIVTYHRQQGRA